MKPIYLVIIDDRHADRSYHAFAKEGNAMAFARAELKSRLTGSRKLEDNTEGMQRFDKHILADWVYSCEGDSIEVREVEVT